MKNRLTFFLTAIFSVLCFQVLGQNLSKWISKSSPVSTKWGNEVDPKQPLGEYPRPQMSRENSWTSLNGIWQYTITDTASKVPPKFNGKILVPYPVESALSGVKKKLLPSQTLWYKRDIDNYKANAGRTLLHFGAVDWKATVFINGNEVGAHIGGYTNFTFDITDMLNVGRNELIVKVYDPTDKGIGPHGKQSLDPTNIYYSASSGIWQTVWLENVPVKYIRKLEITPNIDDSSLFVDVKTSDKSSVEVVAMHNGVEIGKNIGTSNKTIKIKLKSLSLWTPQSPFLYDLVVRLNNEHGEKIDEVKSYFGMRKIEIKKDTNGIDKIYLNNQFCYNLGVLDQGFWPEGLYTAPTSAALRYDIELAKRLGFNTIRKHIKVEPEQWYYYADSIGMLVWQDFVNPNQSLAIGSKELYEKQVIETIQQLYNHCSITTWVIFNENWGQYDQGRMTSWVKNMDSTRVINGHSGELLYVENKLKSPSDSPYIYSDVTDVHSYPMPRNAIDLPGKAKVVGEFGGLAVSVDGHIWNDWSSGWGYSDILTPQDFKLKYAAMVDSLCKLQALGLSASIYTELADVETEQNGFITYDRKVLKLPIDIIRNLNDRIVKADSNSLKYTSCNIESVADTIFRSYEDLVKEFNQGKSDSAFLRNLGLKALRRKDSVLLDSIATLYFLKLENPMIETNLQFFMSTMISTKSSSFRFILKNIKSVNDVLGEDEAEMLLTRIIEKDDLLPFLSKQGEFNKSEFVNRIKDKYGDIGVEALYQALVLRAVNQKDWTLFGDVASTWFKKYGYKRKWITGTLLNNIAWSVFENAKNRASLEAALVISQGAISKKRDDAGLIDTYANLLFKMGRVKQAIEVEESALAVAPGNTEILSNLQRMKSGIPTWPN